GVGADEPLADFGAVSRQQTHRHDQGRDAERDARDRQERNRGDQLRRAGLQVPDRDLERQAPHFRAASIAERNFSKSTFASCGPGAASGWNCAARIGRGRGRNPSSVPSFKLRCVASTSAGSVSASTAKPWFWEVIATWPETRSWTGWLAPRWPNFSLNVFAPNARPRSWCPRQIPKMGLPVAISPSIVLMGPGSASGSPGPLERKIPSGLLSRISALLAVAGKIATRQEPSCSKRPMLLFLP